MNKRNPISSVNNKLLIDRLERYSIFILMFVAAFRLSGQLSPNSNLDPSWQVVLDFAADTSMAFGKELIFTFGPLGYLFADYGLNGHVFMRTLFTLCFSSVFAGITTFVACRELKTLYLRWFWVLWIFLMPNFQVQVMVLICACGLQILSESNKDQITPQMLITILALVFLSLIKFTFMVQVFLLAAFISSVAIRERKRFKFILCVEVTFLVVLLTIWIACGQKIDNIFLYVRSSLEIASGYNIAMAIPSESKMILFAGVGSGAIAATTLLILMFSNVSSFPVISFGLFVSGLSAIAWKSSFVRADFAHEVFFFLTLPLIIALMFSKSIVKKYKKSYLLGRVGYVVLVIWTIVSLGITGYPQRQISEVGLHLKFKIGEFEKTLAILAGSLPNENSPRHVAVGADKFDRMKMRIDHASIDIFNHQQGVAFLNDFNYKPRPVFQGYTAYTPYLIQQNAMYYASSDRPEYVFLKPQTIDSRLPMMDDGTSILWVISNYRPIEVEYGFALFQKLPGIAIEPQLEFIAEHELHFGDELDLSGYSNIQLAMTAEFHSTIFGKFIGFAYQNAPVYAKLEIDGNHNVYRVVPSMLHDPIILSPNIEGTVDLLSLWRGLNLHPVRSISFLSSDQNQYVSSIKIRLYRLNKIDRGGFGEGLFSQEMYPGLKLWPRRVESGLGSSGIRKEELNGETVCMVHPPGRIEYYLPTNAKILRGKYGIIPKAYAEKIKTDGVSFFVVLSKTGVDTTLFARHLDPASNINDRGIKEFEVKLPKSLNGTKILLITQAGPNGDDKFDWSSWADISYEMEK